MKKKVLSILLLVFVLVLTPILSACGEEILTHKITLTSSNIRYGTVQGDGFFLTGETANLIAKPISPAVFVAWIKNDEQVSTDAEYSFVASKETEGKYTAVFRSTPVQYFELAYFTIKHKHLYGTQTGLDYRLISFKVEMNTTSTSNLSEIYFSDQLNYAVLYDYQSPDKITVETNKVVNKSSTLNLQYTMVVKDVSNQTRTNSKALPIDFSSLEIKSDIGGISYLEATSTITTVDIQLEAKFYFYSLNQNPVS